MYVLQRTCIIKFLFYDSVFGDFFLLYLIKLFTVCSGLAKSPQSLLPIYLPKLFIHCYLSKSSLHVLLSYRNMYESMTCGIFRRICSLRYSFLLSFGGYISLLFVLRQGTQDGLELTTFLSHSHRPPNPAPRSSYQNSVIINQKCYSLHCSFLYCKVHDQHLYTKAKINKFKECKLCLTQGTSEIKFFKGPGKNITNLKTLTANHCEFGIVYLYLNLSLEAI